MNTTIKRSRQRDAILECVKKHKDHPTAESIYTEVREAYPKISLGTVYRNLNLLTELGQIRKIASNDNADHFDGIVPSHAHFYCTQCGMLTDFPFDMEPSLVIPNQDHFKGKITEHSVFFQGICENCLKKGS